jgi:hypothetical protein
MLTLVCSQFGEPQVNHVCDLIQERGGTPVIFERYRKDHFITYTYSNEHCRATLRIAGKSYPLTSDVFPCVWSRMKPFIPSEIPGAQSTLKEKFCMYEWRPVLETMHTFLDKSKWINPPIHSQQISRKPLQLKLARQCGLNIPHTIITNDGRETSHLFEIGNVIYKTTTSFCTEHSAIYTNAIRSPQVSSNLESIAMAPGIFQQQIKKQHELRVTIVRNEIFTVKIDSQKKAATVVDWRRSPSKEMYDHGALTAETTIKLLNFHQQAGLIYAAYDFIVDVEGNEFFLECNPGGQWLWLEHSIWNSQTSISAALAMELTSF